MTDLLSGLRRRPGGDYASYAIGYNKALDDVREALLAELDRLAAEEHTGPSDADRGFSLGWNYALAEVRRAVAEGDHD